VRWGTSSKTLKIIILLLSLTLGGCTTIYERGQKIAVIGSDVTDFHMATPAGTVVSMGIVNNSIIHQKVGAAVSQGALSLGTAIATSGLSSVAK
jgi:predicted small secreted protein